MPVHQFGNKPPKKTDHFWSASKYYQLKHRPNLVTASHWSIQKHNNEYTCYASKNLSSKPIIKNSVPGYYSKQKYNNIYANNAKDGFKYWFKDRREIKETAKNWPGKTKPMGISGNFTGLPHF